MKPRPPCGVAAPRCLRFRRLPLRVVLDAPRQSSRARASWQGRSSFSLTAGTTNALIACASCTTAQARATIFCRPDGPATVSTYSGVMGHDATVIRNARPDDHDRLIALLDAWWGGRPMAAMLPKLFFVHFRETSFVADDGDQLAGFLCGFRSQTYDDDAYVHFVGVDPSRRGSGLGRQLYERFFDAVVPRTTVRAVTSPVNVGSLAFHRAMGFEVERVDEAYDGRGEPRVLLVKRIIPSAS